MSDTSSLTSSNHSRIAETPSDALLRGGWGKKKRPRREKEESDDIDNARTSTTEEASETLIDAEVEVQRVVNAPDFTKGSMSDVEVSVDKKTPFQKWNKKKKGPIDPNILSKLVSIRGIPPFEISTSNLRKFCTAVGIQGQSSTTKKACCEAIVDATVNPPRKKEVVKVNRINRKRYINALFSDSIRPKLATRGESVSKDDMTDGFKTDEILHRSIIKEYNNPEKCNGDAYPHLRNCQGNPSKFVGHILWTQSRTTLSALLKEYEVCLNNWKLSGNHGGFGDEGRKPFSDFIQNVNSLLYLHEFVYSFPNVFEGITGELPEGAASESTDTKNADDTSASSKKKNKRKAVKDSNDRALEEFNIINRRKMETFLYTTLIETSNNTAKLIQDQRALKRTRFAEALEESSTCFTKIAMKKRFESWKEEDEYVCSQESIFEELVDIENTIAEARKQQENTLAKIDQHNSDKGNESVLEELI